MIKDKKLLEAFEKELVRRDKMNIKKNLAILNQMLEFAKELGKIPLQELLDGIEIDIKYARTINEIKGTP